MRTDRLHREHPELRILWRDFPLHPEVPESGISLSELFSGRGFDLQAAQEHLGRIAVQEGVELAEREHTSNSRRAQELGKWAEEQGAGEAWRRAVYRAFFVEGRNIGHSEELLAIVAAIGLEPGSAQQVLRSANHARYVDADWQRAAALGIRGVPAYFCRNRLMTGFHPYTDYLHLLAGEQP